MSAAPPTPAPIPAFAPVERPPEGESVLLELPGEPPVGTEVGVEVVEMEAAEVTVELGSYSQVRLLY
jgi:hypothetical protein